MTEVPVSAARADALRGVPLFAALSDTSLARLAEVCTNFEAPEGYVLIQAREYTLAVAVADSEAGHGQPTGETAERP